GMKERLNMVMVFQKVVYGGQDLAAKERL
ncbi:hypothetical protein A2U01_0056124, partial [Trifolium medium]|nr:hypothetical protein [Trifolium medium]